MNNQLLKFSLNHDSVGTRYCGSFPHKTSKDWIPHQDSHWVQEQGSFKVWRAEASVGDKYYVESSVYWARVS